MDTVTPQSEWDEALARLLAFFAALEFGGIEHRTSLAMRLLSEARERHSENSGISPVETAMDVASESLEKWFAQVLAESHLSPANRVAVGLFAVRATNAGTVWPAALLSDLPPADLRAALSRVSTRTGPDLAITSMTSRKMDYGAMQVIAQETWHKFAWAPILRAAGIWTAIFFAVLFAYGRLFPQ